MAYTLVKLFAKGDRAKRYDAQVLLSEVRAVWPQVTHLNINVLREGQGGTEFVRLDYPADAEPVDREAALDIIRQHGDQV